MTLTTLARRALRATEVLILQTKLINAQAEEIQVLKDLSDKQNQLLVRAAGLIDWLELEKTREKHSLVCAWLISLEKPEEDMREELVVAEAALSSEIAQREEYVL